jgi:5-methylcytosine-specific restriction protein A
LVLSGHCQQHARKEPERYDRWRGTSASRGYDYEWQQVRLKALKRDRYLCVRHLARRQIAAATEVHHIIAVAVNALLRLVLSNLESLCHECHMDVTARERMAGVGGEIPSASKAD